MLRRPHRARPLPWESESCRPVNQLQRLGERGLSRTGCSGAEGRSSAGSGTWAGPWGGPGEPPRGEGVQLGQRQRARPRAQSRTRVRAGSREAARSLSVVAGIAAPSAAGCARPAQPLRQSTHPPDYWHTHASPLPGARIRAGKARILRAPRRIADAAAARGADPFPRHEPPQTGSVVRPAQGRTLPQPSEHRPPRVLPNTSHPRRWCKRARALLRLNQAAWSTFPKRHHPGQASGWREHLGDAAAASGTPSRGGPATPLPISAGACLSFSRLPRGVPQTLRRSPPQTKAEFHGR